MKTSVPNPVVEEQRRRTILKGDIPSPSSPPEGCKFSTRCPAARDICFESHPQLIEMDCDHYCARHVVEQEGRADIGQRHRLAASAGELGWRDQPLTD